ncbi:MAG: hypothetical protein RJB61_1863 [Actinomycetota bacterium]
MAVAVASGASCSAPGDTTAPVSEPRLTQQSADRSIPSTLSTEPPSLDELCGGWDAYGATLLALTANAGGDGAAELEIVSAAALVDAIEQIGARWPAELVGERSVVLSDLVGPYLRRAQKALDALAAVGASDDDVRVLALAWREALAARPEAAAVGVLPDPLAWLDAVVVPADLRGLVDAAVQQFTSQVTPFAGDPTLPGRRALVQADGAPRTEAYLSANCPGVGATVAAIEF